MTALIPPATFHAAYAELAAMLGRPVDPFAPETPDIVRRIFRPDGMSDEDWSDHVMALSRVVQVQARQVGVRAVDVVAESGEHIHTWLVRQPVRKS